MPTPRKPPTLRPCDVCRHPILSARRMHLCSAECRRRWYSDPAYRMLHHDYGTLTCACGAVVEKIRPNQVTCLAPACVQARQGQMAPRPSHADLASRWDAPIPPPADHLPRPDPLRPRTLPDGTVVEVVWAGDMVTGAGCRGGLLAERSSRPETLSQWAQDTPPVTTRSQADRAALARTQAARRRQHRTGLHVSGPRGPRQAQDGAGA